MDIVTGEVIVRYVEVLIIGKTRKWKEWYPLLEFMEKNPKVKIDG